MCGCSVIRSIFHVITLKKCFNMSILKHIWFDDLDADGLVNMHIYALCRKKMESEGPIKSSAIVVPLRYVSGEYVSLALGQNCIVTDHIHSVFLYSISQQISRRIIFTVN